MAPGDSPAGSHRHLECSICRSTYTKKEHLERHLRIHSGAKPFSCKVCARAFSRQDSLLRHERLHTRSGDAPDPSGGSNLLRPGDQTTTSERRNTRTPSVTSSRDIGRDEHRSGQIMSHPASTSDTAVDALDFESQLIWPDSEDLFQTIMSADDGGQLPLPFAMQTISNTVQTPLNFDSPSSFDERRGVPSLSNDGAQAVLDVSHMVSAVSNRVTQEISTSSITSLFLDECLHMFFTRFNQSFPILHRPTFVYRELIHPLLLNAIALGSLYLGPEDAVAKGEALWRLAHTAVATSWQTLISHRGPYDACHGVQLVLTALLGQTYAILSKNRSLRTTGQVFHALGFFWARHCGMLEPSRASRDEIPSLDAPHAEKMHKWRMWVAKEIQRRAIFGHFILDGQISTAAGAPTSVRHASNALAFPVNEAAFAAETVDDWLVNIQLAGTEQMTQPFRNIFNWLFSPAEQAVPASMSQHSKLSLLITIEGLQSFVSDFDEDSTATTIGVPPRKDVYHALVRVFDITTNLVSLATLDRLEILLRWHAICLDTAANSRQLGRELCARYNIPDAIFVGGHPNNDRTEFTSWIDSQSARRALLHAVAIVDIVEQLPQGRSHTIHLPFSLFSAAVIYAVYSLVGCATVDLPRLVEWKEVAVLAEDTPWPQASVSEAQRFLLGMSESQPGNSTPRNLFYELNSVRKLFRYIASQWGVAHEMGAVVDRWITLCH